jgi:hypothetical protein
MAKKPKKFIQSAIKHPGSLTKAAESAGKSITQYCASGNLSTRRQRQCNLAKTLRGMNK